MNAIPKSMNSAATNEFKLLINGRLIRVSQQEFGSRSRCAVRWRQAIRRRLGLGQAGLEEYTQNKIVNVNR